MVEPINLNRARKAKTRTAAEVQAAANRQKFGRTKAEKLKAQLETERVSRAVDQAKREP